MKFNIKTIVALCITVFTFVLALSCVIFVLWINQKPNFSKYHSYKVVLGYDKNLGSTGYMQLTDEQFQRIADIYNDDETLCYKWFGDFSGEHSYDIILYKAADMTGKSVIMQTYCDNVDFFTIGKSNDFLVVYFWKAWRIEQDTSKQVNAVIKELIEQYESGREV